MLILSKDTTNALTDRENEYTSEDVSRGDDDVDTGGDIPGLSQEVVQCDTVGRDSNCKAHETDYSKREVRRIHR